MEDMGIFDSGCSGHTTGNKDHLDDFEEYKGGSVTFGGSKGYITGKDIPELTIFNKPQKGIFDEASYDEEGMVYDFNNLPTEVAVSPIPTLRIHHIHPQS
ncbi:hypothetical protein Tco_0082635 [Tanacetum coccineum]